MGAMMRGKDEMCPPKVVRYASVQEFSVHQVCGLYIKPSNLRSWVFCLAFWSNLFLSAQDSHDQSKYCEYGGTTNGLHSRILGSSCNSTRSWIARSLSPQVHIKLAVDASMLLKLVDIKGPTRVTSIKA